MERKIRIPVLPEGSTEVDLPAYYAVLKKSKRFGDRYALVNPLTKSRNLATRKGSKPIDLHRKEIDSVMTQHTEVKEIPISMFLPKDRPAVETFDESRIRYDKKNKKASSRRDYEMPPSKERGRPEILPKNIEHHKEKGTSKIAKLKIKEVKPTKKEPEETKEETRQEEEKENEVIPQNTPNVREKRKYTKYANPEEARTARLEKKRAYQKAYLERKKEGSGIASHSKRLLQRASANISDSGKQVLQRVSDTAKVLAKGVSDYSPQVRALLSKYGDRMVEKIVIGRTPVQSAISSAINAVSFGQFNKNMEKKGYDAIFHLFLEITLQGGVPIRLEKNEVITMTEGHPPKENMEQDVSVSVNQPLTLNQLLENAHRMEGERFFKYDSANNNCQTFVYNLLSASNLNTPESDAFVKQDTKDLFKNATLTRKIAHNITELGAKANVLMKGAGMEGIDNPDLYEKAKQIADEKYKKPSAYKSGFIVKTYKELGGTYSGKKTTKGIGRWFKEDWKDVGHKEYPVYRPTKRVSKDTPLTPDEIDPSNLKEQIALKQKIKGESNLPAFKGKGDLVHIDIGSHNGENYKMEGEGMKDYVVQSVIFPHSYGIPEARKWLKKNGYKSPKVDVETNTIRFRQMTPAVVKKQGFTEYRNKEIGDGIILCLVYKKNISGNGMPKLVKGSQEAKDYMAKMRASRGKKKGGAVEGEPVQQMGGGLYAGKGLYAGGGLYAGKGLYAGGGMDDDSSSDEDTAERCVPTKVVIHHHHHYDMEGGSAFKKFGKELGKDALQAVAKKAIPMATTTAGAYLGGLTGNPVAGAKLGQMAGNKLAGMADKKIEGLGVAPHRVKGSQEAKDYMRRLREKRKKN